MLAHFKAPGKGLIIPPLPSGHQPPKLPQPLHSPEPHSPVPAHCNLSPWLLMPQTPKERNRVRAVSFHLLY